MSYDSTYTSGVCCLCGVVRGWYNTRMKKIFNVVALLCLAAGFGGIVWCGEWRMLLVFPVAFGLGIFRNIQCRFAPGVAELSFLAQLPWTKIQEVFRISITFLLYSSTWCALGHFAGASKSFDWIMACWITGLLLQPWHWKGKTLRLRIEAYIALAVVILCVALLLVFPEAFALISMVNPYVILFVLIVANMIMSRKGVSA